VHLKITVLSLLTHSHVFPDLCDFFKGDTGGEILENVLVIFFCGITKNGCGDWSFQASKAL